MIVTMFPSRPSSQGDRVYSFVASAVARSGCWPRGADPGPQLALDLLHQLPSGGRAVLSIRLLPHDRGLGFGGGTDVSGAVLITAALMLVSTPSCSPPGGLRCLLGGLLVAFLVARRWPPTR